MWSRGVVVVQPGMHGRLTFGGVGERGGIGPFADAALDEALGFAVGLGRIGSDAFVDHAMVGQCCGEQLAFVGRAVVGHHALDGDAVLLEPGKASLSATGKRCFT